MERTIGSHLSSRAKKCRQARVRLCQKFVMTCHDRVGTKSRINAVETDFILHDPIEWWNAPSGRVFFKISSTGSAPGGHAPPVATE